MSLRDISQKKSSLLLKKKEGKEEKKKRKLTQIYQLRLYKEPRSEEGDCVPISKIENMKTRFNRIAHLQKMHACRTEKKQTVSLQTAT